MRGDAAPQPFFFLFSFSFSLCGTSHKRRGHVHWTARRGGLMLGSASCRGRSAQRRVRHRACLQATTAAQRVPPPPASIQHVVSAGAMHDAETLAGYA